MRVRLDGIASARFEVLVEDEDKDNVRVKAHKAVAMVWGAFNNMIVVVSREVNEQINLCE